MINRHLHPLMGQQLGILIDHCYSKHQQLDRLQSYHERDNTFLVYLEAGESQGRSVSHRGLHRLVQDGAYISELVHYLANVVQLQLFDM